MISRRRFSILIFSAAAGLGTMLALSPETRAESKLKFELYRDKAAEFRWRLKAGNGEILATSGEGYKAKAPAKRAIEHIEKDASNPDALTFELYEDAKAEHRWRLKAKNGKIIATSSKNGAAGGFFVVHPA